MYGNDAATNEKSGFAGRFLFLRAQGDLGRGFKYSFAQRFNTINRDTKLFESTDWSFLEYTTPDSKWTFTGGKIVMDAGSFEYDANPIELPFFSQFANRIDAYMPGFSIAHHFSDKDNIVFLLTKSPYDTDDDNFLSYTLEWRAHHGHWEPLYTISCYEKEKKFSEDRPASLQLSVGNRFFWDRTYVEADFIKRFVATDDSFSHNDITASFRAGYNLTDRWTAICKAVWDLNDNDADYIPTVPVNTNTAILGAGIEFYPIEKYHDIKLFGILIKGLGIYDGLDNKYTRFEMGLKWKVNLLTIK